MRTRVFRSGNSLAVRIPKELAFVDAAQDIEVERVGDTLVLRPVGRDTLSDIDEVLAMFSPAFMAAGRLAEPEQERDWLAAASPALIAAEERASYAATRPPPRARNPRARKGA